MSQENVNLTRPYGEALNAREVPDGFLRRREALEAVWLSA
jgi:hypothetical protein